MGGLLMMPAILVPFFFMAAMREERLDPNIFIQTDDENCAFQVCGKSWGYAFFQDTKDTRSTGARLTAVGVGHTIPQTGFRIKRSLSDDPKNPGSYKGGLVWLNDSQLRRWQDLWDEYPKTASLLKDWNNRVCRTRQRNIPHPDHMKALEHVGVMLALILAPAAYGAVNALAWNYDFATWRGRIIRRCSSILVASFGFGLIALGILQLMILCLLPLTKELNILTAVLGLIACVLARAFLLVEAFYALPGSPVGVYQVPHWSAYLPHIG